MFQEDVTLVRKMIKEEIAIALEALKPVAKVAVKVETPKPVEAEVKVEAETPITPKKVK
jgi:hypothetical protein